MNRYNIRIDGEVMPDSYTYEELLLNDILDFDDIEVKQVTKSNWTNIKAFYFPEEHTEEAHAESAYTVDENGQIHFNKPQENKKKEKEYVIDEFGQVVSRNNLAGSNSSSSNSRDTSTASSTNTSTSSNSGDNSTGWKIFFTIVAIIIFIVITLTGD